jgi:FO synthase
MDRLSLEQRLPGLTQGEALDDADALALAAAPIALDALMAAAAAVRDAGHGDRISFSRKVFIPLTQLCRDLCSYCSFAQPPRRGHPAFLSPEQALDIAHRGAAAGCREALFTLGDQPELRYNAARAELEQRGHASTLSYLAEVARRVLEETGLLPHLNPGVMSLADIGRLRRVSASMGLMLETSSERLCARRGPHFGSPDKQPAVRLATLDAAGQARVPFTSGILIGIGETRRERVEALLALRTLHRRHGHLQEVIVQNFRAKQGTRMAAAHEPDTAELCWTLAVARLVLGPAMNLQAPPNLSENFGELVHAGLNDWGGVSPVTPDHVNPEAPWPAIERLAQETRCAGKRLVERLTLYPAYARDPSTWVEPGLWTPLGRLADTNGYARTGSHTVATAGPFASRFAQTPVPASQEEIWI